MFTQKNVSQVVAILLIILIVII